MVQMGWILNIRVIYFPWRVSMADLELPWNRAKQRQQAISQNQERRLAQAGGRQVNSGRTAWYSKRDVERLGFLHEARVTDGKTITVNVEELKKLVKDAIFHDALPAMSLEFLQHGERWTLVREKDHDELQNELTLLKAQLNRMNEV